MCTPQQFYVRTQRFLSEEQATTHTMSDGSFLLSFHFDFPDLEEHLNSFVHVSGSLHYCSHWYLKADYLDIYNLLFNFWKLW